MTFDMISPTILAETEMITARMNAAGRRITDALAVGWGPDKHDVDLLRRYHGEYVTVTGTGQPFPKAAWAATYLGEI